MVDDDDSRRWLAEAYHNPELAAEQIVSFKSNPRRIITKAPPLHAALTWGVRGKRSRTVTVRDGKNDANGSKAGSPATPLDFGSGSGDDDGSADVTPAGGAGSETKVNAIYQAPLVSRNSALKEVRRSGKKRQTMSELQEEEKLLLAEKKMLQREVESKKRVCEALKQENKKLISEQIQLQTVPTIAGNSGTSSAAPRSHFLLPDLNEPASENLY